MGCEVAGYSLPAQRPDSLNRRFEHIIVFTHRGSNLSAYSTHTFTRSDKKKWEIPFFFFNLFLTLHSHLLIIAPLIFSSSSSFIILHFFFRLRRSALSRNEINLLYDTPPSLLSLLLLLHLNLNPSLLSREDLTRHFNLFILDMHLLAHSAFSLTLPSSKFTHTKVLSQTCMLQHGNSTLTHFLPHPNKSFHKPQSCTHTNTHRCWHLWQTVHWRVSPSASIKAIDMNLSCFLHTIGSSSSNIAAVLFSTDTSFIMACAWKIAAYSCAPAFYFQPLLSRERRYCRTLALALAELLYLISGDMEKMRETSYFIWERKAGRCGGWRWEMWGVSEVLLNGSL